ncbi:MAG TPA: glutathione peroxidase [Terriglobia bacterium]|jgi:glutathione peroxidase
MRNILLAAILVVAAAGLQTAQTKNGGKVPDVLSFKMNSLNGQPVDLSKYKGKVVLIVNTASECGYTYQYEGLQKLHQKYAAQGLALLGFPSNDFGQQEPGSDGEIQQFCKANYGVTFDLFSKVPVLGAGKVPLFDYLTSRTTDPKFPGEIQWNFEKFLIGRDGQIIGRFRSAVEPESHDVTAAIEAALAKPASQ